jgi:hypothetical protein
MSIEAVREFNQIAENDPKIQGSSLPFMLN